MIVKPVLVLLLMLLILGSMLNMKNSLVEPKWGKTIPQGDSDIDGNGHGTHCAGTIDPMIMVLPKSRNCC